MYLNFSARTTDWIHNRKRKLLCIYRQPSVLNLICNKGGFTKEIEEVNILVCNCNLGCETCVIEAVVIVASSFDLDDTFIAVSKENTDYVFVDIYCLISYRKTLQERQYGDSET